MNKKQRILLQISLSIIVIFLGSGWADYQGYKAPAMFDWSYTWYIWTIVVVILSAIQYYFMQDKFKK